MREVDFKTPFDEALKKDALVLKEQNRGIYDSLMEAPSTLAYKHEALAYLRSGFAPVAFSSKKGMENLSNNYGIPMPDGDFEKAKKEANDTILEIMKWEDIIEESPLLTLEDARWIRSRIPVCPLRPKWDKIIKRLEEKEQVK